jgi:N-acetyl-anhydromuramyl-L-alanine amidase AmpD
MKMALNRVWIPSPNHSSRGGSGVRLIVVHTTQGGGTDTYRSLGNYFANPAAEVSSHVGVDDTPGEVGEYVTAGDKAWTAGNANPYSIQAELCAMAEWNRVQWEQHPTMLDNCKQWIQEEAGRFNIPIRKISESEAAAGQAGVVGHTDLGFAGNDHWDPGPNFPWDLVVSGAPASPGGGGGGSQPAPGGPAPPFPGTLLRDFTAGHGTATWQQQMANRGWSIDVDDMYGSQSAHICTQFQREKGLGADGIVGPETWAATWNVPVT